MTELPEEEAPPYSALALFYDRVMGDAVGPHLRRCFRRSCARYGIRFSSLADVGCGTGAFLRSVARPGRRLYGVDRSPEMLRIAGRRLRGTGTLLLRQDMRRLALPAPVEVLTCQHDTLNYLLSNEQLHRTFETFARNLIYGGHLLFDIITGGRSARSRTTIRETVILPAIESRWRISAGGDWPGSVALLRTRLRTPDGWVRTVRERHVQRWYPLPVLGRLLDEAGFRLLGVHRPLTHAPASERDFWVHCLTRKYGRPAAPSV
jgi:SAM-dependent methyltransferase